MIRKPISKKTEIILMIISVFILIGLYSFLSWRQHRINPKDISIPNLTQFIGGLKKLTYPDVAGQYWLLNDIFATGIRLAAGIGIGVASSFLIGLGMGVSPKIEALFKLPIVFLKQLPATAMLTIYFVAFGTDMAMYIAMISFGILPALSFATCSSAQTDVSNDAIYKAYTLGASNFEVIFEVVVKQILPRVIDNIRLSVGPALVFLIAAEWACSDIGFGYRLRMQSRLDMSVVYIYLAVLAAFGFLADWTLLRIRKLLCPWFEQ